MSDHNQAIVEEFRANHGQVGGYFSGRTLLLLTHTGARSGSVRTNPLAYQRQGDRIFIFGSKGGAPAHPDWYRNVVAHPEVTVEIGDDTFRARAVEVTGPERDEIYARQATEWPSFGEYQEGLARTIPVVELVPEDGAPPPTGSG